MARVGRRFSWSGLRPDRSYDQLLHVKRTEEHLRRHTLRIETLEDRSLLSMVPPALALAPPVAVDDSYWVVQNTLREVDVKSSIVAECGFNDAAGIHSDATANSPYQMNATIHDLSSVETDWSSLWAVSNSGATPGPSMRASAQADSSLEGDGALKLFPPGPFPQETVVFRQWGAAQSTKFVQEQWVRTDFTTGVVLISDLRRDLLGSNRTGPQWEIENGYFWAGDGDGAGTLTYENTGIAVRPGQWQKVSLLVDPVARTYQFYVDEQRYAAPDPLNFRHSPSSISAIDYLDRQDVWIDGIRVRSLDLTGKVGVLANDTDPESNPLTAVLVAAPLHGTVDLFANGSFQYRPAPGYTGADSFTYKANDGTGDSNVATVNLTVSAAFQAPTDIGLSATSVVENRPAGTTIGQLSAVDSDAGDQFVYTLVDGPGSSDNAAFTIVGDTLKTATPWDYETKSSYSVRVRVTDLAGLWYEEPFTVTVIDENLPPTDIALSSNAVLENRAVGTLVGDFSAVDGEPPAAPFT